MPCKEQPFEGCLDVDNGSDSQFIGDDPEANRCNGLGHSPLGSMARHNERSEVHHAAVRAKLNKHCYHQHLGTLVFDNFGVIKLPKYCRNQTIHMYGALFGLLI